MVVSGAATSLEDKNRPSAAKPALAASGRLKTWLRSWYHVLIGELLHLLEPRPYSRG
jgi:hypothetical protein